LEGKKDIFFEFRNRQTPLSLRHTSAPGIFKIPGIPGQSTSKNAVFSRFFPHTLPEFPESRRKPRFFPGGEKIPGIETKTPLFSRRGKRKILSGSATQRLIRAVTDFIQLKYTYLFYVL